MGHGDQRKYLVIDLETTGLEEDEGDEILEIAAIAVNADLTEHARFERIVQPRDFSAALGRMKPFVQKMHTDNGLLAALRSGQGSDVHAVEESLVGFIQRCDFSPGGIILAGNSVHFDRGFLDVYMSKFTWLCSHRLCDVSGTHRFLRDLCGLSFEDENRNKRHRAMDDALESLELAQRMRKYLISAKIGTDACDTLVKSSECHRSFREVEKKRYEEALHDGWVLLANAYGGAWEDAPEEWRTSAERWRDRFIAPTPEKQAELNARLKESQELTEAAARKNFPTV